MRLSKIIVLLAILLAFVSSAWADIPSESTRPLPATIGKFKRISTTALATSSPNEAATPSAPAAYQPPLATELSEYADSKRNLASVEIDRLRTDAKAYQALSFNLHYARSTNPEAEIGNINIGTAAFATNDQIAFFKGQHFVQIKKLSGNPDVNELAQILSDMLDKGEGDVPALIKHLPELEFTQKTAVYMNNFADLSDLPLKHPVLNAIQAQGNADAVLGTYGLVKILIVEFNTPQLATDNDQRIIARIQELWKLGEPAPTAYRRVGNYSVLVFDAPDPMMANHLIDEVKYEQVVQWLGENPNILKEAEKRYVNTTLGVLVAVLKASGYAAALCLGIGGLIGGLLFSYRRSQQKDATAYSDAGGMLRLNLDELSAETNAARLLRERN